MTPTRMIAITLAAALTTSTAFATLAVSRHHGLSSMGILLAVAILATVVCALILLPAGIASFAFGDEGKVTTASPPIGLSDQFPSDAGSMVRRSKM